MNESKQELDELWEGLPGEKAENGDNSDEVKENIDYLVRMSKGNPIFDNDEIAEYQDEIKQLLRIVGYL